MCYDDHTGQWAVKGESHLVVLTSPRVLRRISKWEIGLNRHAWLAVRPEIVGVPISDLVCKTPKGIPRQRNIISPRHMPLSEHGKTIKVGGPQKTHKQVCCAPSFLRRSIVPTPKKRNVVFNPLERNSLKLACAYLHKHAALHTHHII